MIWTPRVVVQILGVGICVIGFLCLPVGWGASPRRDTSLFFNFADLGLYLQAALILIPAGIVVALLSFLLPGSD
jgi:hypothetical protein